MKELNRNQQILKNNSHVNGINNGYKSYLPIREYRIRILKKVNFMQSELVISAPATEFWDE